MDVPANLDLEHTELTGSEKKEISFGDSPEIYPFPTKAPPAKVPTKASTSTPPPSEVTTTKPSRKREVLEASLNVCVCFYYFVYACGLFLGAFIHLVAIVSTPYVLYLIDRFLHCKKGEVPISDFDAPDDCAKKAWTTSGGSSDSPAALEAPAELTLFASLWVGLVNLRDLPGHYRRTAYTPPIDDFPSTASQDLFVVHESPVCPRPDPEVVGKGTDSIGDAISL